MFLNLIHCWIWKRLGYIALGSHFSHCCFISLWQLSHLVNFWNPVFCGHWVATKPLKLEERAGRVLGNRIIIDKKVRQNPAWSAGRSTPTSTYTNININSNIDISVNTSINTNMNNDFIPPSPRKSHSAWLTGRCLAGKPSSGPTTLGFKTVMMRMRRRMIIMRMIVIVNDCDSADISACSWYKFHLWGPDTLGISSMARNMALVMNVKCMKYCRITR